MAFGLVILFRSLWSRLSASTRSLGAAWPCLLTSCGWRPAWTASPWRGQARVGRSPGRTEQGECGLEQWPDDSKQRQDGAELREDDSETGAGD